MFCTDEASNGDYMLYRVKDNVKNNLEYYYHANTILTVFAVGAFLFYITTGVSRGIFLLLDLFLMFKSFKKIFEIRKIKKDLDDLEKNLKYIKALLVFDTIILVEATIRYFLDLNIAILEYLWIVIAAYSIILIGYKVIKSLNKKRIYKAISENKYEDVILLKRKKEKLFTVITLFLVVILIMIKLLNIINGINFIALMTLIYTIILFFNIDMSSEVSIEYNLLINNDISNIERKILNNILDEDYLSNESICISEDNIKDISGETLIFDSEDLEKTTAFDSNQFNEIEEEIKSRVERNKNNKNKFLNTVENLEYGKYIKYIKGIKENSIKVKNNISERIKAVRKIIDRDK